jgi:hypothetical protein
VGFRTSESPEVLADEAIALRRSLLALTPWQVAIADSVDRLSLSRLGEERWLYHAEVARLPSLFAEMEQLIDLCPASRLATVGVLALTDRRLVFAGHERFLRRTKVVEIPLDEIDRIESKLTGKRGRLRIFRVGMGRFDLPEEFHGIVPSTVALEFKSRAERVRPRRRP